jgi:hypothetical protein
MPRCIQCGAIGIHLSIRCIHLMVLDTPSSGTALRHNSANGGDPSPLRTSRYHCNEEMLLPMSRSLALYIRPGTPVDPSAGTTAFEYKMPALPASRSISAVKSAQAQTPRLDCARATRYGMMADREGGPAPPSRMTCSPGLHLAMRRVPLAPRIL